MTDNHIGIEGAKALSEMLQVKTTIDYFYLHREEIWKNVAKLNTMTQSCDRLWDWK